MEEFKKLLQEVDNALTTLPATAQVASQQGIYIASLLNNHLHSTTLLKEAPEFKYNHMGSFAYIGNNDAAIDLEQGAFSGLAAWLMWRSTYLSKQYSLENMVRINYSSYHHESKITFFFYLIGCFGI